MNLEARPICLASNEHIKNLKPNLDSPVNQSIIILDNIGYKLTVVKSRVDNLKYRANFVRSSNHSDDYPRFHLILETPTDTFQPKIASFHIDIAEHVSYTDFFKKTAEYERIIRKIREVDNSGSGDELISLFVDDLLRKHINKVNKTRGETADERWKPLLQSRKEDPSYRKMYNRRWKRKKVALDLRELISDS